MKYAIKNGSHRGKAFKVPGGIEAVKAGEKAELNLEKELSDVDIAKHKADGVIIKPVKVGKAAEKQSE